MAEESMMSTAESGIEPPPGAPAGAGAQAEMITKKLANFWCIIGSIPLVMFLLVAIPTIFYVKKFSEYVNAEYCETKSCRELADAIAKATGPPCANFGTHVCSSKADFMAAALTKITEATKSPPEGAEVPKGTGVIAKASQYYTTCQKLQAIEEGFDPFYHPDLGDKLDYKNAMPAGKLSGFLSTFGFDGLVRAVAIVANTSGNQDTIASLELSAPIYDFYPRMLIMESGMTYEDIAPTIVPPEDDDILKPKPLTAARKKLDNYILNTARTSTQTRPKLMKISELKALPGDKFKWGDYLGEFAAPSKSALTDDTLIRLLHPKYLLGLNDFLEQETAKVPAFIAFINVMQQVESCVFAFGHAAFKEFKKPRPLYCVLQTDRLFPGVMGHTLFYKRAVQFGANTGINPGGTNATAMATFLDAQVREMLDSMAFSYSLSTSATEENRVAFYRKTLNITVAPGFFNNTDGLTDTEMVAWAQLFPPQEDPSVYEVGKAMLSAFKDVYWQGLGNKSTTFFKYRNPYHSLHSTFTATEDHLYVPMGVFTPPIFRNSQKNRIFAATSGYLVMTGMMKAIDLTDSMVIKGQLTPENWIGYSWTRKIEKYADCLAAVRKSNESMDVFTDPYMAGAVTPALRYYRRKIFEKAYPRPEFRIDWVSELSSTQLFFYAWGMLHCGSTVGPKLIDVVTKTNRYFLESFQCEAGLAAYKKEPCDLWNTTRRDY